MEPAYLNTRWYIEGGPLLLNWWHTEGDRSSSSQLLWSTNDEADYHTREESQLRLTDSSTSLSRTATIEDDALTSGRSQIDT